MRFKDVDEALDFMAGSQLHFPLLIDGHPCWLEFGVDQHPDDWQCPLCSSINYHYRIACFKCQSPKGTKSQQKSLLNDGSEDVSKHPSPFLILRNIPLEVDEKELYAKICKPVWMARDKQTYAPRGFAFVEYPDIEVKIQQTISLWNFLEC